VNLQGAETIGTDPELYALKECGRRISDVLNQKLTDGGLTPVGRWLAFRLDDGSSDKVLYDTHAAAIEHQTVPCMYEPLRPTSYSADEAALMLHYARAAYEAGWRDDVTYPSPIRPVRTEDAGRKVQLMTERARRTRSRSRFARR
jgi:hypothetical protein